MFGHARAEPVSDPAHERGRMYPTTLGLSPAGGGRYPGGKAHRVMALLAVGRVWTTGGPAEPFASGNAPSSIVPSTWNSVTDPRPTGCRQFSPWTSLIATDASRSMTACVTAT